MTESAPSKKGIQAEMVVAVSAVFIGVCALAVSLYETKLMREEQRASVLPIVELGRSHYTTDGVPLSYGQSTINGRTIPADRSITMFDLSNTAIAADIVANFDRFNFEACYCSVFGDCWKTDYAVGFSGATVVPECKRDDDSFME